MKNNKIIKTFSFFIILLISFSSITNAFGADKEIILQFGTKPNIDGTIDKEVNEWNDAIKSKFFLYKNISNPENGLELDLWIVQYELFLYIAILFELTEHENNEFIGILTSEDESLDPLDYEDAKIIQFINVSEGDFEYRDYYINESSFYEDSEINGVGAAKLDPDGERIVYEFQLPVESSEGGDQDIRIEAGVYSPFMIIFGESQNYDEGIKLMNLVSLFVQFYAYNPIISVEELIYITLASIIFTAIGTLYGYYLFQIIKLKDKIEKIRS